MVAVGVVVLSVVNQDDTLLLLNDQSGLVLGDSTVFFLGGLSQWPPCLARRRRRAVPPVHSRSQATPLALALHYP
jgi:hypothetical protein